LNRFDLSPARALAFRGHPDRAKRRAVFPVYVALAILTTSCCISCSRPSWPSGKWRPYSDASPFNTPLPANAPVVPNSPQIVRALLGDDGPNSLSKCTPSVVQNCKPNNMVASPTHTYGGWPTYSSHKKDPLVTVQCSEICPLSGLQLHIPAGAAVQAGSPDRHLTVIDDYGGLASVAGHAGPPHEEYDFYQVQEPNTPRAAGTIHVASEGTARLDTSSGVSEQGNTTASGFANLAGRIRAEELAGGEIRHALTITISCNNGSWVYPATASGNGSVCGADRGGPQTAPPIGALFQLNVSPDTIQGWPILTWKKTILTAMSRYGMYFNDSGGAENDYFSLQTEAQNQYSSLGLSDVWFDFAQRNSWSPGEESNLIGQLQDPDPALGVLNSDYVKWWHDDVWSRLQVVSHCVLPGSPDHC